MSGRLLQEESRQAEIGVALRSIGRQEVDDADRDCSPGRIQNSYIVEYPEGGLQAWLVVLGAFCALFLVFGIVNTTAVFQAYLSTHQLQSESPSKIGWIFSINLFLTFFCGIFSGNIFDKNGPRLLVFAGSVAIVLAMMLLGLCQRYWHFMLTYGVLGGIGGALLMTPAFASVGHFFNRRRALATGLANTSGSIGGVVIPLMLRSLIDSIGFAWSTRILGCLFIGLAIPANLFLRAKRLPTTTPESLWPDMSILRIPSFVACVAGMFLMEWGLFVVLSYIASYVLSSGERAISDFVIVALLNAGSFFGRWIPGLLADRFGRFNVIIGTILLCSVTILAFWLPAGRSAALIVTFAITFGFASGSNLGLIPVCLSQLCLPEQYGRYLSAAYFFTSFGTLTSIPIGGAILEGCGGRYYGLIIFSGVAYLGALVCYIASRVFVAGSNWKKRV